MKTEVRTHLDRFVELQRDAAPADWVRLVLWWVFLADERGVVDRSGSVTPQSAVRSTPEGVVAEHFPGDPLAAFEIDDLDEVLAGEPEEGWTVLRVEIDRDGPYRADFSHEPARPWENAATDPFFDDVHDYAARHHDELAAFVTRLREQGDLPLG